MEQSGSFIFLILLIGIFYFMLIRPQRKRVQQHKRLIEGLDAGDEIVTIGGLHGVIREIGDEDLEVEVAPGITLVFVKSAVARVVEEDLGNEGSSEEEGKRESVAEEEHP